MRNDLNQMHMDECHCFVWKPVFVGALVAIGLSFLLNLFSVAIGLTAFTANNEGIENLALGGLIATALGIVVSMFGSGWLAGYLGSRFCKKRHLGALYGFLTWCVALLIMVIFAEYLTKYVTFYTHFISGSSVNVAAVAKNGVQINSNVTTSPANLVISTYIVFCLFFLSAFASSLGGHCGMRHECKDN